MLKKSIIPDTSPTFRQRFPNHAIQKNDINDWVSFSVLDKKRANYENFDFLFKPPYLIITGDYLSAVYKFNGIKELSELRYIARRQDERYLSSKCETGNMNLLHWEALAFFFEEIEKLSTQKTDK